MWRFVLKENIARYKALVAGAKSERERQSLTEQLTKAQAELAELEALSSGGLVQKTDAIRAIIYPALDETIRAFGANFGNLQIYDEQAGGLIILGQRNFRVEFLRHFAVASPGDGSSCGRCFSLGEQVAIADVDDDDAFAPHREAAHLAGYRSVVSSPLRDQYGNLFGVMSVHFTTAQTFTPDRLEGLAARANAVGAAIGRQLH